MCFSAHWICLDQRNSINPNLSFSKFSSHKRYLTSHRHYMLNHFISLLDSFVTMWKWTATVFFFRSLKIKFFCVVHNLLFFLSSFYNELAMLLLDIFFMPERNSFVDFLNFKEFLKLSKKLLFLGFELKKKASSRHRKCVPRIE